MWYIRWAIFETTKNIAEYLFTDDYYLVNFDRKMNAYRKLVVIYLSSVVSLYFHKDWNNTPIRTRCGVSFKGCARYGHFTESFTQYLIPCHTDHILSVSGHVMWLSTMCGYIMAKCILFTLFNSKSIVDITRIVVLANIEHNAANLGWDFC